MIEQYDIVLVNLDPTIGHEIKKTRPAVVLSPNEMNKYLKTITIAPLNRKSHPYPSRVPAHVSNQEGWIVLDQIRTIDKIRIVKFLEKAPESTIHLIKKVLREIFVD